MTPTTYGRDFAYCLKSHGGVRGFNASLWRFLLRCTLFCHSVATFLTSVSSYEGGCGFEVDLFLFSYYTGGMVNVDVCHLTYNMIQGNQVIYKRMKFPKIGKPLLIEKSKTNY